MWPSAGFTTTVALSAPSRSMAQRYACNAEFREKRKAYSLERYRADIEKSRSKARERYASNPAFREKSKARMRERFRQSLNCKL